MIKKFMHSETQDGKCLIDAHFAHATFHVLRYLKSIRRNRTQQATTPLELVIALASFGGLQNCGVQLVSFDEESKFAKLEAYANVVSSVCTEVQEYFSRANEIVYFPDKDCEREWAKKDLSVSENLKTVQYSLKVFAYSRIGEGAMFDVDIGGNTVIVNGTIVQVGKSSNTSKGKWSKKTIPELKRVLKERGLGLQGKKADLVKRLNESDLEQDGSAPAWDSLTVKALKKELKKRNLAVSGRKLDLVERLRLSDLEQEEADAVEQSTPVFETEEDGVDYVVDNVEQEGDASNPDQLSTRDLVDATEIELYNPARMLTGVTVTKRTSIGETAKKSESRRSEAQEDSMTNDHIDYSQLKDVPSRAVALIALGQ